MQIKQTVKYRIAAPTSMGVRLTPPDRRPVHTSDTFVMQATSAESNVLSVTATLAGSALAMTTFVKESPIASFIKGDLRRRGIDYIGRERMQEGPWGVRHQFNIADAGRGLCAPRVHNDRAGEVGRLIEAEDFDTERLFFSDGIGILHISGLFAALSDKTAQCALTLAETAKKSGTAVSFDLNYRASFWHGREKELRSVFCTLADRADILVGNEEDFQLCLGLDGPPAGGKGLSAKLDGFRTMIETARKRFSRVSVFATTLREVLTAERHLWGSVTYDGNGWSVIEPREIAVYDRIGGGDAFVGGLLYGLFCGWETELCNRFGWACGALAAASDTDYIVPVSEEQVWQTYHGNARIRR